MTSILQTLTLLLVLFSNYLQAQNAVLCPAPNGLFVNPNIRTCRSFIHCTNGIGVLQRCRRGTIFSGQQCIPGNQQTCNRVNANHFDDAFRGPGTTTPNPLVTLGLITQPGVWNAGVQPLPGIWNNNGQVNTSNPSNNGSPAADGQIRKFNPGFLGAWFDANLQRTGDRQWLAVNVSNNRPRSSRGQTLLLNWPNVNANAGNNQTVQVRRANNWP